VIESKPTHFVGGPLHGLLRDEPLGREIHCAVPWPIREVRDGEEPVFKIVPIEVCRYYPLSLHADVPCQIAVCELKYFAERYRGDGELVRASWAADSIRMAANVLVEAHDVNNVHHFANSLFGVAGRIQAGEPFDVELLALDRILDDIRRIEAEDRRR